MKMRIINIVLALWLIALGAKAQYLGVENSTLDSGQESEIVVNISGATSMTGVQFYLQLPAGVNFAQEGGDYGIVLGEATEGHTMSITPLGTGDYLVVLYSIYQETFGDGELLRIPVVVSDAPGTTIGKLTGVRTATSNAVSTPCSNDSYSLTVKLFGDVNGDGVVDVADVTNVVSVILDN